MASNGSACGGIGIGEYDSTVGRSVGTHFDLKIGSQRDGFVLNTEELAVDGIKAISDIRKQDGVLMF